MKKITWLDKKLEYPNEIEKRKRDYPSMSGITLEQEKTPFTIQNIRFIK